MSTKKSGSIISAFSVGVKGDLPLRYKDLKDQLRPKSIEEAWKRLIDVYNKESEKIKQLGSNAVPQVDFKDVQKNNGRFPPDIEQAIRKAGCVVIRGVIDRDEALNYKKEVCEYIDRHPGKIDGFPSDDPQVWELYWTKSQVAARAHQNLNAVSMAMNCLWHATDDTAIDLTKNVTYCDRLSLRMPEDTSFTLDEHVDGGSVERWEDPEYRKCYQHIFDGEWEKYDPFDATNRVDANMNMYDCSGGCSMFRTFQGCLSLSDIQSPEGGSLKVCPLMKETTSYLMMRPLLPDMANNSDMAGAIPGSQQLISLENHPHIMETMVSFPKVEPGDCFYWSADTVHAVDKVCKNPVDCSVFYIPTTPLCAINTKCLRLQRDCFEAGLSPPDFPGNNNEVDFEDRARPQDMTELGKLGMGYIPLKETNDMKEGQLKAIRFANSHLF